MDLVLERILECMGNNGSNRSYLKHLRKIAEFYDVSEDYLLGKTSVKQRPVDVQGLEDILSDPDLILFARHTQKIPEADRKRILNNFRETIDIYLQAIGLEEERSDSTEEEPCS